MQHTTLSMTRITLCLVCMCLLSLSGCKQPSSQYRINGFTKDSECMEGYRIRLSVNGQPIDSTYVHNGHFLLEGNYVDTMGQYLSTIDYGGDKRIFLILGETPLTADLDRQVIKGDSLNNILYNLYGLLDSMHNAFEARLLAREAEAPISDFFNDEITPEIETYHQYAQQYLIAHPNDPIGIVAACYLLSISHDCKLRYASYIRQHMGPVVLHHPEVQYQLQVVDNYLATGIGAPMLDGRLIALPNNQVRLLDYLSLESYKLIHFWSGWCKPCIEILNDLHTIYQKYAERGLLMIGIYTWDDIYHLNGLLEIHRLPWPQFYDVDNNTSLTYGVIDLPELILVSPDNKIIARGSRGQELLDKIDSICH